MDCVPLNLLLEYVLSAQSSASTSIMNQYYPIIFKKLENFDFNNFADVKCKHNLQLFLNKCLIIKSLDTAFVQFLLNKLKGNLLNN